MKILIDNNILIDYFAERKPFFSEAREIVFLCYKKKINGYVAAHSITDGFYILREIPLEERRKMFLSIFDFAKVIGIDEAKILSVLNNPDFKDLEDCLQSVCDAEYNLDYIVTRNGKDFVGSSVLPITPTEFLAKLENE